MPTDAQLDLYKKIDKCVTFKVTEVPFAQYGAKLSVALASSNAPDIISVDSPSTASFASQGALLSLDKYLASGYKDDVDASDLKEATYKGQMYSLPVQQIASALFFNKDLTDAAGITVPSTLDTAWTWKEAQAAMLTCQAKAGNGVMGLATSIFQASVSGGSYRDQLIFRSAGDPTAAKNSSAYKTFAAISSDGKTVDGYINSPEAIDAAKLYQGLFSGPDAVSSPTLVQNQFVDGKACFDITAPPLVGAFDKLGFTGGVAPVPYITTPIVHSGAVNISVPAKSEHAALAAAAVVGMTHGDVEIEWANSTGSIPTTKSDIAKSTVVDQPGNKMALAELEKWGQPRPVSPKYTQYDLYLGKALQSLEDGSDPKQTLDQAAESIDSVLSK